MTSKRGGKSARNRWILVSGAIMLFAVLGCNMSTVVSALFATPTPTVTLTPTPTDTPTVTLTPTPTNTPIVTLTPTPTNTPTPINTPTPTAVPLLSSPIIPFLKVSGFVYNPDFQCIATNPLCNEYYNQDLQIEVILSPGDWIEFNVWITTALANGQSSMLDLLMSEVWGNSVKSKVDGLVAMTTKVKDSKLESNIDSHYVSAQLFTQYEELILLIGPLGSGDSLVPTTPP